ncbi:hypothetical protein N7492_008504 [Penicillium capsulatum]|uniref:HSF-type DNA-binding domain-containing protein n=1 Tax=Penicillium capsulatum TaxID=69766 RepID=A0A9W9HQV1_9EURO|nr:hypothetical protein N7492_008504 [Penicillium capsulatum]KAJ6105906.1 hypothetical protein N7512_009423 [Penicillium capsulatum]
MIPTNGQYGGEIRQTVYEKANDFIACRRDRSLRPLHFTDISLSEFSAELVGYLSVLNEGGSIAFSRGENLAGVRLSKSLERLFSTPTPLVTDGPPLSWTTIILSAGPHFHGPSPLKIGESVVELSHGDLELLRSGRPWRFLSPWPDKDDCEKELQSILEKISEVERCLKHHRDEVAKLPESQHLVTRQGEVPHLDGACGHPLCDDPFGARTSGNETSGNQDPPPSLTGTRHPSSDQPTQLITQSLEDRRLSGGTTTRNEMQRASQPQPVTVASQGFRLHASDFIQKLSDGKRILDDARNKEAMRWSEDGRSFFLGLESKFPAHLHAELSTKSYQSLVRKLYYYGFHKTGGAYHHELFIRGQASSIKPARQMSHSPSPQQRRPRYKVIPRKRGRESI